MYRLHQSPWAQSIRHDTLYARPFPLFFSSFTTKTDPVPVIPHKENVLIGTRFHSRYIGMYNQFLEYHPGNDQYLHLLYQNNDHLYHSAAANNYTTATNNGIMRQPSTLFQTHMLQNIIQNHEEEPSSSFLKQDEMTGFWYKMTSEQVIDHTIRTVTLKNNPFLSLMDQEISFLQEELQYQFPCRNTDPLRHITLQYLSYWRDVLFGSSLRLPTNQPTPRHLILS